MFRFVHCIFYFGCFYVLWYDMLYTPSNPTIINYIMHGISDIVFIHLLKQPKLKVYLKKKSEVDMLLEPIIVVHYCSSRLQTVLGPGWPTKIFYDPILVKN